jgi:hypothetical protein
MTSEEPESERNELIDRNGKRAAWKEVCDNAERNGESRWWCVATI